MSAELEIIDGRALVLGREPMWHKLGKVVGSNFDERHINEYAPEILSPVYKVRPSYVTPFGVTDGTTAGIVREIDGKLVGEGVGYDSYGILQPQSVYELGQAIAQVTDFPLVSAGLIREGRQFFFTYRGPDLDVNSERIQRYISVCSSHDGSMPLKAVESSIIVVCANTFAAALKGGKRELTLRHTSHAEDRLADAIRARDMHVRNDAVVHAAVERLQLRKLDVRAFDVLLDGILPTEDKAAGRSLTMQQKAREAVRTLYMHSPMVGEWKHTGWGFVQAVNTYEQWGATVRGVKGRSTADVRAERQFDSLAKGQPLTQKALELVSA